MSDSIIAIDVIVASAVKAAEDGATVHACPYPADSPYANRWRLAFYSREKEIRAEVEV